MKFKVSVGMMTLKKECDDYSIRCAQTVFAIINYYCPSWSRAMQTLWSSLFRSSLQIPTSFDLSAGNKTPIIFVF